MKREVFLFAALVFALIIGSCARMEERAPRYDEKECPVCSSNPGVCFYCKGSTKCHFCEGTGKRTTVTPYVPREGIEEASYEEECPYCKGSGVCRYCDGSGKCWACDGNGKVDNWEFYEKYKKEEASKRKKEAILDESKMTPEVSSAKPDSIREAEKIDESKSTQAEEKSK
ncbi:MAG: hypothetical protein GF401_17895 [Chitinivibrionales bacterium]|nr:hypothetical protein [Chitinivibrionales bacterium]